MGATHGTARRSRRRWLLVTLVLIVAVPMAAAAVGWWALRSAGGRAWLLALVTARVEHAYGVHLDIGDFTAAPWRGVLELRDVAVGSPAARPFLTTRRVRVEVDPSTVLKSTLLVRALVVEEPRLDLGAPPPPYAVPRGATPSSPVRAIELQRVEIRDGSVGGGTVPMPAGSWVSGWSAERVGLEGSFRGGRLDARLTAGAVKVARPGETVLVLSLAAHLDGSPPRDLRLVKLEVSGPGLSFTASGGAALDPPGPIGVAFAFDGEPALLVPELAVGGRVAAQGEIELRARSGRIAVQAHGVSLAAARGLVPRELFERFEAGNTLVDLEVQAAGFAAEPGAVAGAASLGLRRGDRDVLTARCDFGPGSSGPTRGVRLSFAASLLPSSPGRRHAVGTLAAPSWPEAANGHLENARLEVNVPDLAAAVAELHALWPGLVPPVPNALPVVGSLDLAGGAQGPLAGLRADVRARWRPGSGAEVDLVARGWPLARRGEATFTVRGMNLRLFDPRLSGSVSGFLTVAGSPGALRANIALDGNGLAFGTGGPSLDEVHLEAETDGKALNVRSFSGAIGRRRFAGSGWAAIDLPLHDARLDVHLVEPADGVAAADIALAMRNGTLIADASAAETPAGPVVVEATVPLATLRGIPGVGQRLAAFPVQASAGPIHVWLFAPALDSCSLLPALGISERPERARGALRAELWVDPSDVPGGNAEVVFSELSFEAGGHRVASGGPITLRLAGGRVDLEPASLRADTATLDLGGTVWLARSWDAHDAPASLVERFRFDVRGQTPAPLANPLLIGGGKASGVLDVALHAEGTPAQPTGTLKVDGRGATFFWPLPYATKITQLVAEATLAGREVVLREGRCRVNGGAVEFTGRLAPDLTVEGQALFSDVRYRLDFGLGAVLSGDLSLAMPPGGRSLLSGRVSLDRGWLSRDLDLEHEVLPAVLGPPRTVGTQTNRLDAIDLAISLDTVQGVRVKNNLANLRASWEPLEVTGTAWNPRVRGRVDVEPGGLVYAAGQVFRLDRASATFMGDPATDPRLDFATTSSLQDPTIRRTAEGSSFFQTETPAKAEAADVLSSGLASVLGQRVGETLGLGEVTVRPVPVWGEADPTARLTASRALSANASFLVSLDLRNAQRQTYILDLHGFSRVPTFGAQVFTNDKGHQGATLQQTLELGGTKHPSTARPVLGQIVVEAPATLKRGAVHDAIRLRSGETIRTSALLDTEVDVAEALRSLGYTDAEVSTALRPAEGKPGRQDLVVSVVPGPRAEFRFVGDSLPIASRSTVTALYRSDYYEAESLGEMHDAAVRAFRSLGHLDPEVAITVTRSSPAETDGDRLVTVTARGGRRAVIDAVDFTGVPQEDSETLASRFYGTLDRSELAAGLPDADARVVELLRRLGYREGRVLRRELVDGDTRLVVLVATGARERLTEVSLVGVSEDDARRLAPRLGVRAGNPVRADLVAGGAVIIAEDFRSRGFADVRVTPVLRHASDGAATDLVLTYEVKPGTGYRVADVRLDGLRWTDASFAKDLVGLSPGEPLRGRDVVTARSRLLGTGLFSSVLSRTEKSADGGAVVTLSAAERPPFTLSYGLRWESEVGGAGVLEFVDHNVLGRAVTAGAQLRYERDDRSARLYLGVPGVLGTRSSLEAFAERRRVVRRGLVTDSSEATLQLSRPFRDALTAGIYARYNDTHLYEAQANPFEPPYDVRVRHPYVGAQLFFDTRNDAIMATRGVFASTDLSTSSRVLGSDFNYLRWYSQLNLYQRLASVAGRAVIWGQSVRVGLARAYGQDLIPDARFYAGGSYSVRGYASESLGPTEELGGVVFPVGGAALLVVNEELRASLLPGITGLVFFDAGQVWAEIADFGSSLAKSCGLGLRAATPLGLIRFDVARPLDAPPGAARVQFSLGFGNVF